MNKKGVICLAILLVVLIVILLPFGKVCSNHNAANPVRIRVTNTKDLLIYTADSARLSFQTKRPSTKDDNLLLCIVAAFTGTGNNGICGHHVEAGKYRQGYVDHKANSGYCVMMNDEVLIKKTDDSISFYIDRAKQFSGSLFQQNLLVYDGHPVECKLFGVAVYMRALAIIDGMVAIIETTKPTTFTQFSSMMCRTGVDYALYLDMGGWDEGWYRDRGGSVVKIGHNKSRTNLQTNWLVLKSI